MLPELLSPEDPKVVDLLGSPKTQANLRACGRGPRYIKIGRRVRYREQDLAEFVESNLREAPRVAASAATAR